MLPKNSIVVLVMEFYFGNIKYRLMYKENVSSDELHIEDFDDPKTAFRHYKLLFDKGLSVNLYKISLLLDWYEG